MGAGFVRFGGISALLLIAVFAVMIAVGASAPMMMQNKAVTVIFTLVLYGLVIIVFLATRSLWSAFGRHGGSVPIIFMILMLIVSFVLGLLGGGMQPGGQMGENRVFGIVYLVLLALYVVAWFWFVIYCMVAGGSAGGIWKATGILYLIGTLIGVVAAILGIGVFAELLGQLGTTGGQTRTPALSRDAMASATLLGVVAFVAGLVLLGGWICHAIGLLVGAGRMERQR